MTSTVSRMHAADDARVCEPMPARDARSQPRQGACGRRTYRYVIVEKAENESGPTAVMLWVRSKLDAQPVFTRRELAY